MYLMINNYDSFVYNLVSYFVELGQTVKVVMNDEATVRDIEKIKGLKGIIISPGPKGPEDSGIALEIVRRFKGEIPILGVCLGHQVIGYEFGARIEKGLKPMHGKVTAMVNNGQNLFRNLPGKYQVTRYHSLIIDSNTIPPDLAVDALSEDGAVMSVSNAEKAIFGIQFHPEAVLTEYGHELLMNYIKICEEWKREDEHRN